MGLMGSAVAQVPDGFNMPFSQFGLGSSELPYNMPMMTRLGGVAYTRAGNNFVNPFNPASYASIEVPTRAPRMPTVTSATCWRPCPSPSGGSWPWA